MGSMTARRQLTSKELDFIRRWSYLKPGKKGGPSPEHPGPARGLRRGRPERYVPETACVVFGD